MAEKSGTIGLETVSRRGLAALRVVHRRAPHASPGDTGVEEERPVTMSKKRHAVDGRWAVGDAISISDRVKIQRNYQKEISSSISCRTSGCA